MPSHKHFRIIFYSLVLALAATAIPVGVFQLAKNFSARIALGSHSLIHEDIGGSTGNFVLETSRPPEDFFRNISLGAQAVYVYDARLGRVLFEKNAHDAMPLASLTKVMTALVASDFPKDFPVEITHLALEHATTSSTTIALKEGDRFRLSEILPYMLLVSSNESANAVALAGGKELLQSRNATGTAPEKLENDMEENEEEAFVAKMNSRAQELGLSTFAFENPSGLDVEETKNGIDMRHASGYGSAKDMTSLFAYILNTRPEILAGTAEPKDSFTKLDGTSKSAWNTNPLAARLPGLLGSKTGYTDIAGGNLALAFDVGPMRPVIIVILGSTKDGRFTDAEKLIAASVKAIAQ